MKSIETLQFQSGFLPHQHFRPTPKKSLAAFQPGASEGKAAEAVNRRRRWPRPLTDISMSQTIEVENIAKRFENVDAVSGISFHVQQGELFGFLEDLGGEDVFVEITGIETDTMRGEKNKKGSGLGRLETLLPGVVAAFLIDLSQIAWAVFLPAVFLRPFSYLAPLTYGADVLHGAVHGGHRLPFSLDLAILSVFCVGLFAASLRNIRRHWIVS
jgi:hypothetical protein